MGSRMGRRIRITLLVICFAITTSLLTSGVRAQSCKSYSFQNNRQFASCNDLPQLNAHLYWTYNSANGTADIAFRATNVNPSTNWVAWALNPNASGMPGAQAIVAYRNSSGPQAYPSSVSGYSITTLSPSKLSFAVDNIATTITANEIIIFATITPPSTTVNQVWQVGSLSNGMPSGHPTTTTANTNSKGSINFLSGQTQSTGSGGPRQRKKNVHGVLNAVSWGTLMPLGAIIARYLRVFKSADPAWFYLHVSVQFSAYVVGVAGWGLGLRLGSLSQGIVHHAHRNIGIALFCLATLQVFALLLRPQKDHKYRLYWNIYHHSVGYTVIILSIINIFEGFDILGLEDTDKWKRVYIGILIVLGAIAVVLELITWGVVLKRKKNTQKQEHHHANGANGYTNGYHA